ncbi:ATP-grasp domain-containing protein [Ancylobacter oerskovii]|uniref:ATP-grasp domain-containing protein n=1 Tax=Ancylobacter oerskovii TaxID=459519 RepID=A0ABW4YXG6_9HYPH|nr:ATP-grasp domain-containing protein [Ancylobacter oerskovii]MBS7541971.1 ATP-grasp domain-containing protein [Ancylobacter oerskovii]
MPAIAVAALSARALAAAARRAGLEPLVFDLFGDADTRELAATLVTLRRRAGFAIDADDLLLQLDTHVDGSCPLVLGSGFEAMPDLVDRLAARGRLAGNDGAVVRRLKDPFVFSDLLSALGIPHPRVFAEEAPLGVETLEKAIGASGGGHVHPARRTRGPGHYLQERIEGGSASALFLANGRDIRLVAFSEQWCAPDAASPFRYGGAAGPIALEPAVEAEVTRALGRLAEATGLVGLASADLILSREGWSLIELNPRPGATLDLFDRPPLPPLLRLHLDACAGRLPDLVPLRPGPEVGARAAGIFYAPITFDMRLAHLPPHAADRPAPGTRLHRGEPVCTVFGEGRDAEEARGVMLLRMDALWHEMQGAAGETP